MPSSSTASEHGIPCFTSPTHSVLTTLCTALGLDTSGTTAQGTERLRAHLEQLAAAAHPHWSHTPEQLLHGWAQKIQKHDRLGGYRSLGNAGSWGEKIHTPASSPLLCIVFEPPAIGYGSIKEQAQSEATALFNTLSQLPDALLARILPWSFDDQRCIFDLSQQWSAAHTRLFWAACERNAVHAGHTLLLNQPHVVVQTLLPGQATQKQAERRQTLLLAWMRAWHKQDAAGLQEHVLESFAAACASYPFDPLTTSSPLPLTGEELYMAAFAMRAKALFETAQLPFAPPLAAMLEQLQSRQDCIEKAAQSSSQTPVQVGAHQDSRRNMLITAARAQDTESVAFFLSKDLGLRAAPASSVATPSQLRDLLRGILDGPDDALATAILQQFENAGFDALKATHSEHPFGACIEIVLQQPNFRLFPVALAAAQMRVVKAAGMRFEDVRTWQERLEERGALLTATSVGFYRGAIRSALEQWELEVAVQSTRARAGSSSNSGSGSGSGSSGASSPPFLGGEDTHHRAAPKDELDGALRTPPPKRKSARL